MRLHDMGVMDTHPAELKPHRRKSWPRSVYVMGGAKGVGLTDGVMVSPLALSPTDIIARDWEWYEAPKPPAYNLWNRLMYRLTKGRRNANV